METNKPAFFMLKKIIFGCLIGFVSTAYAEETALELADAMGGKSQFNLLSHQTLNQMIQKQPELARYQPLVAQWGKETLTWEKMRVALARDYESHFSEQEMRQMLLFFRTDAGQKYLKYAPLLKEETVRIGQRLVQQNQPELMRRLAAAKASTK